MSQLSKFFHPNQKRDTTYNGTKPVTSLSQVQGGPEYYSNISSRLRGEGVGYGDQYANQASNPVIARMKNQFQSYDLPALQDELSATGRRRGSAGFDQIRRAYQEEGLNEGDVYSGLYQKNEDQKRNEVNDALNRTGNYAQNEANLVGQRAAFDTDTYQNELAQAADQKSQGNAAFQRMIGTVTSLLPTSMGAGGVQSTVAPQAPTTLSAAYNPNAQKQYYPGVNNMSSKVGQQGGIAATRLRLK